MVNFFERKLVVTIFPTLFPPLIHKYLLLKQPKGNIFTFVKNVEGYKVIHRDFSYIQKVNIDYPFACIFKIINSYQRFASLADQHLNNFGAGFFEHFHKDFFFFLFKGVFYEFSEQDSSTFGLVPRSHMSSIIEKTEGELFVGFVESNDGSIIVLQGRSGGDFPELDGQPVEVGGIGQGTDSVANDIILSAVQHDLEVGDGSLGEEIRVVLGIAQSNIGVEVKIGLVNTVLECDVRIDTIGSLGVFELEPIIIRD